MEEVIASTYRIIKKLGSVCHMIVRVPHQGAAECGFSGTVRSHEYVGLAFVDR